MVSGDQPPPAAAGDAPPPGERRLSGTLSGSDDDGPPRARRLSAARMDAAAALEAYAILDTSPQDAVYDDLAQLAADACDAPFCGVTFLDWRGERQFWKSSYGLPAGGSPNVPLPDEAAERMNVCAQARPHARARARRGEPRRGRRRDACGARPEQRATPRDGQKARHSLSRWPKSPAGASPLLFCTRSHASAPGRPTRPPAQVVELPPGTVLVVEDALTHPQFSENPCITSLGLRMVAATALVTPAGQCVGTVVVMDTRARTLSPRAQEALRQLSRAVVRTLELRGALLESERLRAVAAAAADAAARVKDELVALVSHEARAACSIPLWSHAPLGPVCKRTAVR
jgi:GAF domain-containing protein